MKMKNGLKAVLLTLAAGCGVGVAYGQSGLHGMGGEMGGFRSGSGAMSQQAYMSPTTGCDGGCDVGTCDVGYGYGACDEGCGGMPGFFGGAEWLSWQVSGSAQTYASALDPVYLTERYNKSVTPKGNGVRGRVGYRTASMWDVGAVYTYFKADDSGGVSSESDPGSAFVSTRSRVNIQTQSGLEDQTINYNDKIELQTLDFEVGRRIEYGCFDFRPFGGFRWLELDSTQGGDYQYASPNATQGSFTRTVTNTTESKSKLTGYGLRMGAEANVDLFGGFRAFGRGAGSVLVGKVKSTGTEDDAQAGQVLNRNYKETIALPGLEAAAGLAWKYDAFEIKGGYELNTIFNATNHNGQFDDLLFHGFFAGASLNF